MMRDGSLAAIHADDLDATWPTSTSIGQCCKPCHGSKATTYTQHSMYLSIFSLRIRSNCSAYSPALWSK